MNSDPFKPRLCLGGSFNPIHHGHLRCAEAAALARGFDTVLLIPSAQPPHKPVSGDLASASDRLAMTRLAATASSGQIRFEVDDLEINRPGPSYTLETVRQMHRRGWKEIWWLIGADMLNYLPQWHRVEELLQEVNFLILARPGIEFEWDQLPPSVQRLRQNIVATPLVDISATDIRKRVREGLPIDHLVPGAVANYIGERRLYRRPR